MISILHLLCNVMRKRRCGISKQPKEACLNFAKLNVFLWDIIFTPFKKIYKQKIIYIMRIYWGWWDEPAIRRGLPQVPKSGVEKIVLINEIGDWTLTQHIIIFVFPFVWFGKSMLNMLTPVLLFLHWDVNKKMGKTMQRKVHRNKGPGGQKTLQNLHF